jgi:hypothetical protein
MAKELGFDGLVSKSNTYFCHLLAPGADLALVTSYGIPWVLSLLETLSSKPCNGEAF